jgi:hypothetical protein
LEPLYRQHQPPARPEISGGGGSRYHPVSPINC